MPFSKDLTSKFFPGLGDQHVVGLVNVGVTVVDVTIMGNTTQTDAQIVLSPPNTQTPAVPTSVVVHSLGAVPSAVLAQPLRPPVILGLGVNFAVVTMDNSAVYIRAMVDTINLLGVSARVTVIR